MKKALSILLGVVVVVVLSIAFILNQKNSNINTITEENFHHYKGDRETIISMLTNGEIQKEADRNGNEGFYFYYTPSEYYDAVKSDILPAKMYSKENFFVFFQSAEQPKWDTEGLVEGFLYTSTGVFPSPKEFGHFIDYKKIDEHWYFGSSDSERFAQSCLTLCK